MKYFKEFDESIMKPILIYKYSKQRKEKQYELFLAIHKKGQHIETIYADDKHDQTDEGQKENEENQLANMIRKNTVNN